MRNILLLLSTVSAAAVSIGAAYAAINAPDSFRPAATERPAAILSQADLLVSAFHSVNSAERAQLTALALDDYRKVFSLLAGELDAPRGGAIQTRLAYASAETVDIPAGDSGAIPVAEIFASMGVVRTPRTDMDNLVLLAQICVGQNCPPPGTTNTTRDPGPPSTTGSIDGYN